MHKTGCQFFLLQDVLTVSFVNFWLYCFVLFLVYLKGKLVFHMGYPSIWNVFTSTLMCLTGIQFTLLNHSPLQTGAHCLCLFQLFAIVFKTTTTKKHEHTVCGFISVLQFHWFSHRGALMRVCVNVISDNRLHQSSTQLFQRKLVNRVKLEIQKHIENITLLQTRCLNAYSLHSIMRWNVLLCWL